MKNGRRFKNGSSQETTDAATTAATEKPRIARLNWGGFSVALNPCYACQEYMGKLQGQTFIDAVKLLNFPSGEYVVVGSGPMAALNIRAASDIDITVSPELFNKLRMSGEWREEERYNRIFLEKNGVTIIRELAWPAYLTTTSEAIKTATVIDGVPFLNLLELKKFKTALGRENDFQDILLIDEYLKTHPRS